MKLLLDTHILLWWLDNDSKLSDKARQLISNPDNDVYVSDASLWEIQIKYSKGKLGVDSFTIYEELPKNGFHELSIQKNHIIELSKLPPHHKDPFDRILVTQSLTEPLVLITHDKNVARYNDSIILV